MITAVTDRLEITLDEAKAYFRADTDDGVMECVEAAKSEADAYMQNDFSSNGMAEPIPAFVKMWVLKRANFHYVQRIGGLSNESVAGIGSATYDGKAFFSELNAYRKKVVKFV